MGAMTTVAVLKETAEGERRVALVPDVAQRLLAAGLELRVQAGAGERAHFGDDEYAAQGVQAVDGLGTLLADARVVLKVRSPLVDEVAALPAGAALISFLPPNEHEVVSRLAERGVTAFSLDLLPRITRAQSMDALSSQATVAGYRAALIAAGRLGVFLPMLTTAAGTVPPAKVLVLGAGVAGLQAIATIRRLGGVVSAHDVRPASREEVESLGARFVDLGLDSQEGAGGYAREQSAERLARQRELLADEIARSDAVISTAAVPGRPAPLLITREMVEGMKPGSVIVDLAAESGGNCELSKPGVEVVHGDVLIYGALDVASSMPTHASQLLARNVANLLLLMIEDGEFAPDFDDTIVSGACVARDGEVVHPAVLSGARETSA
ncbi:Re/Si-specific NAD(P)(+) transhydrogenase subunit alpha [soil metagenome]